jgi:hypothetical protein
VFAVDGATAEAGAAPSGSVEARPDYSQDRVTYTPASASLQLRLA